MRYPSCSFRAAGSGAATAGAATGWLDPCASAVCPPPDAAHLATGEPIFETKVKI
jgi:hypothetical protein